MEKEINTQYNILDMLPLNKRLKKASMFVKKTQ